MNLYSIIVRISFLTLFTHVGVLGFVSQDERKCTYLRMNKLLKIRCFDMNLKEVPQYLSTSVVVLDLSFNRIKKLKKSSFQKYTQMKYLLLYENMIQSVEPDTFSHLTSLEEIDLSNNALRTIPLDIFQLPSLRNLYVDSNDLINLSEDLQHLQKPINAPLEYLNVADCGLNDIPDLGILPRLWHLNASSNSLQSASVQHFAQMCHLKSIDLTSTMMPNCACQQVKDILTFLGVNKTFFVDCDNRDPIEVDSCPSAVNTTVESVEFRQCSSASLSAKGQSLWVFLAGCLGGILLVLLVVMYCVHKRKVKRSKQKVKKKVLLKNAAPNAAESPSDELLRDTP